MGGICIEGLYIVERHMRSLAANGEDDMQQQLLVLCGNLESCGARPPDIVGVVVEEKTTAVSRDDVI